MTTPIVDSHVHLIDPERLSYPWLPAGDTLHRRWDAAGYAAAAPGIAGVIVVEAGVTAGQAGQEIGVTRAQAASRPWILGIVAQAPVSDAAGLRQVLPGLAADDIVAGVRWNLQDEPPGAVGGPGLVTGIRRLGQAGLSFDACVRARQLPELDHLAAACPDTVIVLDHAGKPRCGADLASWRAGIRALAVRPNVRCKLSGLATEATPGAGPDELLAALRIALAEFGAARCMYGSDWPVCMTATSPSSWLDLVMTALAAMGASRDEQAHVLAGTSLATYRLKEAARMPPGELPPAGEASP
jgi:L-fuconolactonase